MTIITDWKELSRKEAFKKYGRAVDEVWFELPDGKKMDYYLRREGPTVCVLAVTADNKVILASQFRPGPKKIMYELPGGFLDKDKDPMEEAKRELLEETGYSGDFELVTTCWDDAYSSMLRYCFVARNCKKVAEVKWDEDEFIEIIELEVPKFREILRSGEMTDVEAGYLGLDKLGMI